MAPTTASSSQQPERKKRRQNVACDSCRLRRVKCDMLAILTPKDTTRAVPPLHVLVRENPDVSCSNCISKGIRCTTNQIVNPAKPNKGGKRIEEAKKMYGSDGSALTPPSGNSERQTPHPRGSTPVPHSSTSVSQEASSSTVPTSQQFITATSVNRSSLGYDLSNNSSTEGVFLSSTDAYDHSASSGNMLPPFASSSTDSIVDPSLLDPRLAPKPWSVEWGSSDFSAPYGAPFSGGMYDPTYVHEPLPWKTFITPPTPSGGVGPTDTSSPNVSPAPLDPLAPSLTSAYQNSFATTTAYRTPQTTLPYSMASSLPATSTFADPLTTFRTDRFGSTGESLAYHFGAPDRFKLDDSPPPPQLAGRKRTLSKDGEPLFRLDEAEEHPNPWSSNSGACTERSVRWTRREQVSERLADRALESELSRHLVRVYFQAVHLTLPGISPESFFLDWRRAGERSDRMSPPQEVLCAVLEAWAARFSDHPVVLGFDPDDPNVRNYSPKVILDTGQFVPASPQCPDRSGYGRKRIPACIALVNRVRRLIDMHGILRKPSVAGVQALVLFTHLQHMTDVDSDDPETLMETEMMHGVAITQMKLLKMTIPQADDGDGMVASRAPTHLEQLKFTRLFWTLIVSDSFWAAASCNEPKIMDEDMEATRCQLVEMEAMDGPPMLKKLAFFLKSYFGFCMVGRKIARRLSVPTKRPGRVDLDDFCTTVREVWSEVRTLYIDLNMRAKDVLLDAPEQMLGTSPVHTVAGLRQCGTFLLLIVHQVVEDMAKFRKSILASYGDDPSIQKEQETARLKQIERLQSASIDHLLVITRAQTPLFKNLLPTGMLQASSMMLRVLLFTTEFLSQVPTNEQGYPDTTAGGIDWTWATKQREVGHCLQALFQFGWAWSDVSDSLVKVRDTMRKMQPDVQQLMAYAAKSKPRGYRALITRRQSELDRDARTLDAAMLYWPPRCVPLTLDLIYDRTVDALPQPPASTPVPTAAVDEQDIASKIADEIFNNVSQYDLVQSDHHSEHHSAPVIQPDTSDILQGEALATELEEFLAGLVDETQASFV